jgi:asparagine synthase (glutamine-hydrolysing)
MSGIFAYFSRHEDRRDASAAAIAHRLSTTEHVQIAQAVVEPGGVVGTASLQVYDWERRPARTPDGSVSLWMVGEFFHHGRRLTEAVRTSGVDLERDLARFALEVYQHEGVHGLTALSGTYQIAIWDRAARELTLVNDRLGFYPHYLCRTERCLVLAPSLHALLAAGEVPLRPDTVAMAQFLRFQHLLGTRTWVEGVSLIPPASIVRYSARTAVLRSHRYWDWDRIRPVGHASREDALEECSHLFSRAVAARTRPRTALLLSGGLDSRTILAFSPESRAQLTLTFGARESLDAAIAQQVAAAVGCPHEHDDYRDGRWVEEFAPLYLRLTDGAQSVIHSHGLTTLARIRGKADAVMTGWGGGTIIGGYLDSYKWDAHFRSLAHEGALTAALFEAFCRRLTWPGLTDEEELRVTDTDAGRLLRGVAFESFEDEFRRTRHVDPAVRLDGFYIDQHERRCTLTMHVMARGFVEARAPFKDDGLVDYFLSLPEAIRRTPWLIRAVLNRQSPMLAAIPYERDGLPPHPSRVVRRMYDVRQRSLRLWRRGHQTRLYADYEHYLRADLRGWAEDMLFGRPTRQRALFNHQAVRALWQRHLDGGELWTIGKIMPLITIEQVARHLFDAPLDATITECPSFASPTSTTNA